MKDVRDPGTVEMTLAPKRGRGRPSTGKAKSAAERMREYRARSVTVNRGVLEVALGNASQVEAVSFQVDGMDRLAQENRQLRERVAELEAIYRLSSSRKVVLVVEDACDQIKLAMTETDVILRSGIVSEFAAGLVGRCRDHLVSSVLILNRIA